MRSLNKQQRHKLQQRLNNSITSRNQRLFPISNFEQPLQVPTLTSVANVLATVISLGAMAQPPSMHNHYLQQAAQESNVTNTTNTTTSHIHPSQPQATAVAVVGSPLPTLPVTMTSRQQTQPYQLAFNAQTATLLLAMSPN
eukprot:8710076-Ditylum_brightwellii.AAC.1